MKENCCGNCKHFTNEDVDGKGWCEEQSWITECRMVCKCHEVDFNGWTEITPDNMSEVYNIQVNRLVIAWEQGGMTVCRMLQDISPTISTMAKIGGYYYMELPELKIEQNGNKR
jgi:hypothetical protein